MERGATVRIYHCSGLTIASDIPLTLPEFTGTNIADADVRIRLGESRTTPLNRPDEDLVAELIENDFPRYSFFRVAGGYVARIMGVADFDIDHQFAEVVCHPDPNGPDGVLPIIIVGSVLAFLLSMRGWFVLHGSAVEWNGQVLAFVGISGQGKSTMAALFCADGAALVTDDVLPLEFETDGRDAERVLCLRSANEVRLREKASELADRFDGASTIRVTADQRRAVAPGAVSAERVALGAIVLPRPDRHQDVVTARRLTEGEASYWLARCQRIEGWRDRDSLRRQFADVGRVVSTVPVFEVSVPWGPPFSTDIPARVIDVCGLAQVP